MSEVSNLLVAIRGSIVAFKMRVLVIFVTNTLILNATIDFLIATKRFDASLPYIEHGLIVLLTFS